MTTTTDQGVRCGNHGRDRVYHADRNAVRACFTGQRTAQPTAPSQAAPRNADEARTEAAYRLARQNDPFGERHTFPASPKQVSFLKDLANQVLIEVAREALLAKIEMGISSKDAKQLITDMLVMRGSQAKQETAAPRTGTSTAQRNALVLGVMGERTERNFAIIDEEGKARFYRFSQRGKRSSRPGTWKIQERVSDSLFPRSDYMLATVVEAIAAQGGAEAAGRRFAELMHRCYECGASLTDTTGNPYYAYGLGPECGAK